MNRFSRTILPLMLATVVLWLPLSEVSAQGVRNVVLVRHAEKAVTPPNDPELDALGIARAQALADVLEDLDVSHVITSQYRRTVATAEPLISRTGASHQQIPAGLSDEALQAVVDAVDSRPAGESVLIVGHSNTIPSLVAALGGTRYPDLEEHEYDSIFLLQIDSEGNVRTVRLRFGAPNG